VEAGGLHNTRAVYDWARIHERSRVIGLAIDARRRHFLEETPFVYAPAAKAGEAFTWDAAAKAGMRDYNLLDLGI
jgi:ribosomal protein L13E